MKKLLNIFFLMFCSLIVCAQNTNAVAGLSIISDSLKTKIPFENYWTFSLAYGKGLNSEFIPQTENVWASNISIRAGKQHPKYILGIGYDAQTLALRNTASGTTMYNEIKHFGNPQHSFYGFADKIKRLKKVTIYYGVLAGICSGKSDAVDSTSQFMMYESSKGYVIGAHLGLVKKMKKNWSLFFEFEPKLYGVNFDFKNKNGSEKSVDFRIKTFPIMVGVQYALKR